jgi:hypothetical protein
MVIIYQHLLSHRVFKTLRVLSDPIHSVTLQRCELNAVNTNTQSEATASFEVSSSPFTASTYHIYTYVRGGGVGPFQIRFNFCRNTTRSVECPVRIDCIYAVVKYVQSFGKIYGYLTI